LALAAERDGERNEGRLVAPLLKQLPAQPLPTLIMADRGLSRFEYAQQIVQAQHHFLLRKPKTCTFVEDPERPAQTTQDRYGRPVTIRWGYLTRGKKQIERIDVRLIEVQRTKHCVQLLTDLREESDVPACALLDAYLERWTIESLFQHVAEVFDLKHVISGTPEATVFQLALCLLLSNSIAVITGYMAQQQKVARRRLSVDYIFREVRRQLDRLNWTDRREEVAAQIPQRRPAQLQRLMIRVAREAWRPRFLSQYQSRRDPSKPPKPKPPRRPAGHPSGHNSAARLIDAAKKK
jgi:hypothetical protein